MRAWKGLAAFAIAAAAAVGGFAVYTFGWHDDRSHERAAARRVITLHDGDVVVRPSAATRCEASGEGGRPNLFCTRIHGGRHQVIFYSDAVLVWPLDCPRCGPDGPVYDYLWTALRPPRRPGPPDTRAARASEPPACGDLSRRNPRVWQVHVLPPARLSLRCPRHLAITGHSLEALDPRLAAARQERLYCARVDLHPLGLRLRPPLADPQGAQGRSACRDHSEAVSARDFPARPDIGRPGPAFWIVHVRERCVIGVCGSRFETVPRLTAVVRGGRVAGFYFPVGAEGE
jgi:hypothetical protein